MLSRGGVTRRLTRQQLLQKHRVFIVVPDLWIVKPTGWGEATVLFNVPWSGSPSGRLAWKTDRRGGNDEARENDNKDER